LKILYFDCFSGISGDMILGAMLDAGIDEGLLRRELAKLPIDGYELQITKKQKNGITGTDVDVVLHHHEHEAGNHHHEHRNLHDIEHIIDASALDDDIKQTAKGIFMRLAQAEAHIHGTSLDQIHFHEVGAVDSIIDITGAAICFHALKPDAVYASPLNVGSGFVKCQHGLLPVPAPAALELLRGVPIYSTDIAAELVTPTGAAVLSHICRQFGPMPLMNVERIGYGLGKRDLDIPNALRIIVGEQPSSRRDEVAVLECNIDDMNPELYGYAMDKLFDSGALDVFYTPIIMKKDRPAVKITVLCRKGDEKKLSDILIKETSTLGVRSYYAERTVLPRHWVNVSTPWGTVRVKAAEYDGGVKYAPEYEDCARAAHNAGVPLRDIYQFALAEALKGALEHA
jgi:hypothetical protein